MAYLLELTMFVLAVAIAGLCVLINPPLLEFLPSSPAVIHVTAPFMLLALAATYYMGVVLVYLQVAPAAAVLMSLPALRRFAALACAFASALLLLLVAMPLVHVLFLADVFW